MALILLLLLLLLVLLLLLLFLLLLILFNSATQNNEIQGHEMHYAEETNTSSSYADRQNDGEERSWCISLGELQEV